MNFVNLTKHEITVQKMNGDRVTFPPCGVESSVAVDQGYAGLLDGVPTYRRIFGSVENIPAPVIGTAYIVGSLVFERSDRPDLVAPDSGETAVRENGRVIAVTQFIVR